MRKILILTVFIGAFAVASLSKIYEAHALFGVTCPPQYKNLSNADENGSLYQGHCGLWLCVPGGFGEGCSLQKTAFNKRLAKRCTPLPAYSQCKRGEDNTQASYQMGQAFQPCKSGYNLRISYGDDGEDDTGTCMNADSSCERRTRDDDGDVIDRSRCGDYGTPKKNYIDITIDQETYPRYWW